MPVSAPVSILEQIRSPDNQPHTATYVRTKIVEVIKGMKFKKIVKETIPPTLNPQIQPNTHCYKVSSRCSKRKVSSRCSKRIPSRGAHTSV